METQHNLTERELEIITAALGIDERRLWRESEEERHAGHGTESFRLRALWKERAELLNKLATSVQAQYANHKTRTNLDGNIVLLTELEAKVVEYLENCDEYSERHYAHIDDIAEATKIDPKQLRGVLSSLDQKKVLYTDHDFFRKGDTIIFLF